jgi:hypothetical protein
MSELRGGEVPDWLGAALRAALRDMQQPRAIELSIAWEPPSEHDFGTLWFAEAGQRGSAGMSVFLYTEPEYLKVVVADWMQDQLFPETAAAWGEARPACPGHPHPAQAEVVDGVAVWRCPRDGRVLAPVGEL